MLLAKDIAKQPRHAQHPLTSFLYWLKKEKREFPLTSLNVVASLHWTVGNMHQKKKNI